MMKTFLFLLVLLSASVKAYQPQAPQDMLLKEDTVLSVSLNRGVETMLAFPFEIQLLSGSGLFSGQSRGDVQYQVGATRKTLILNPVKKQFKVLMQVTLDRKAYVVLLTHSEKPASVVRFHADDTADFEIPEELDIADVEKLARLPSRERLNQLMHFAKQEDFLRPNRPDLYVGYDSKLIWKRTWINGVVHDLNRICKFQKEDTLIVIGSLPTARGQHILRTGELWLHAGNEGLYRLNHVEVYQDQVSQQMRFIGLLVGDGQGKPAHISLNNEFSLKFKATR